MIEVNHLSFWAGNFLVEDVCLRVADGQYFVMMGRTGTGKSLLVKCICGLIRPASGTVAVNGRDVTGLPPRDRGVGYVPQEGLLFPHLDVAHNITFGRRFRGVAHGEALDQAADLIETLDLEALLNRRTTTLSGGERQKVALARALATEPELLVLDEPVSALDEPTRREVCQCLKGLQRQLGIPTIHICHNIEEAATLADLVGVMHAGRLVQSGTLEAMREAPADRNVAALLNVPAPELA